MSEERAANGIGMHIVLRRVAHIGEFDGGTARRVAMNRIAAAASETATTTATRLAAKTAIKMATARKQPMNNPAASGGGS